MLTNSKTIGEAGVRIELISRIIHEVNNQLTTVVGYSQMLANNNVIDKDLKKDAEAIFKGATKASITLRQLQYFLKGHEPIKKRVDLNELVQQSVTLFKNRSKLKTIHAIWSLDSYLETMLIDPGQIQRVLLALLDIVECTMSKADVTGTLHIATKKIGNRVQVQISDNAHGISGKELTKLGQPSNWQENRDNKEMLVLLICQEVINNHGGQILVDTEFGEITSFFIELPISGEESLNDVKAIQDYGSSKVGDRKGLIVDDDVCVAELLGNLLDIEGIKVERVYDGESALERIDKNSYDFILLDVVMPKLDGLSLYRKLKEKGSPFLDKVIFITGDVVSADAEELFRSIKSPRVSKPFDLAEIKKTILQVLNPL